ncbi:MAG: PAS domain-containing sensor histidine kinase [bacterium]
MDNSNHNIEKPYNIGLCPWASVDFKELLQEDNYAVTELEEFSEEEFFPQDLDAMIIDFASEEAAEINRRAKKEIPRVPRILITAKADDLSEDHRAFAILHRPVTAIEILDILIWACESKRIAEKSGYTSRINDHPRVDVFLEETALKLLPSARWLSAIFEYLPIGLILFNPKGEVVRANNEILESYGFSEISAGENCGNIVPWRETEGTDCRIDECLSNNKVIREVLEIPGGQFLEVIHVPVVSAGSPIGVLMIVEDVSAEATLTNRLLDISDVIDEGIVIVDKDFRYVWVNEEMRKWFGIDEGYEAKICKFVIGEDKKLCENCQVKLVFEDGQMHSGYFRAFTKDGEKRIFEMIAGPIRNKRGEVVRAVKILRDVTGRENVVDKLAMTKSQLEDSNAELSIRLNELHMITELSVALQTVENLENNLHIFLTAITAKQGCGFNRAFLFLINRNENTLEGRMQIGPANPEEAGRIWTELESQPATFADVLEKYGKNIQEELIRNSRIQEVSYSLTDHSSILVKTLFAKKEVIVRDIAFFPGAEELSRIIDSDSFALVPLLAMGKPVGIVVVDNKVSGFPIDEGKIQLLKTIASHASLTIERSQLLDELRDRNEQLRETYRKLQENQDILIRSERLSTIGKLAAQVAHEIRNPLVSIGGFARNIAKRSEPDSPIRKYSNIIWDETKRLEEILEDVLSYSRHAEPKLRDYDLNNLLTRTVELLKEQMDGNGVEVVLDLGEDVGEIYIDPDQIRQVMMNLMKNAIGAMPEGGTLKIHTRIEGGFIWTEISDTGSGIPDEYRDKIFEPFFTTKSTGTGLGLPISYQIIDAHGGMLWFSDAPNGGTIFHVKLPAK